MVNRVGLTPIEYTLFGTLLAIILGTFPLFAQDSNANNEFRFIRPEARELARGLDWSDRQAVYEYVDAALPDHDYDLTPMSPDESNWESGHTCPSLHSEYVTNLGLPVGDTREEKHRSTILNQILHYIIQTNVLKNRDCSCANKSLRSTEPVRAMFTELYGDAPIPDQASTLRIREALTDHMRPLRGWTEQVCGERWNGIPLDQR